MNICDKEVMDASELKIEQRKIIQNAIFAAVVCAIVLLLGRYTLPLYYTFPTDLTERIAFAIKASLFVLIWVVIAVRMVSRVRFLSAEDNKGSALTQPSAKIAIPRAFLQNTLEQAVIAAGAYLAFATLVSAASLSLVPSAVILFSIGRVTFLRGYPEGAGARAFGMVVTVLPTMLAYIFCIGAVIASLF
jgi:hypothetical protein